MQRHVRRTRDLNEVLSTQYIAILVVSSLAASISLKRDRRRTDGFESREAPLSRLFDFPLSHYFTIAWIFGCATSSNK
jgi:hypothetical protein